MKKRLRWILPLASAVVALFCLAIWIGAMVLERMYDDLRAEAESLGMSLTIPEPEHDADAERYRAELKKAFQETRLNLGGIEMYTEDPHELAVVMREIRRFLPTAYALSNCKSFGEKTWGPTTMAGSEAITLLQIEGNGAIAERDLPGLLAAAAAIRRIAHIFPSEELLGSAMISIFAQDYCSLLQRAAEAFGESEQIEAIFGEANKWELRSFDVTAARLAGNEMRYIDEEAASPPPDMTGVEKVQHALTSTSSAVKKGKVFAAEGSNLHLSQMDG